MSDTHADSPTGGGSTEATGTGTPAHDSPPSATERFNIRVLSGVVVFVAAAFLIILFSVLLPYLDIHAGNTLPHKTLLRELSNTEVARGLITFLVAVGTIAVAYILIVFVSLSPGSTDQLEKRFSLSKQVLTSLVGILGTIVGFYFGASQDHRNAPLALANVSINPATPAKGDTATIHAEISGGQGPYYYSIRFTPNTIKEIDGRPTDGMINEKVKLDGYDPSKVLDISLEGRDSSGATANNRIHLDPRPIGQDQTSTPLALAAVSITPPMPDKSDVATIHAEISGGQGPYYYSIRFTPGTIEKIDGRSTNGMIDEKIKLDGYDPSKALDISLEGRDATGVTGSKGIHLDPRRPRQDRTSNHNAPRHASTSPRRIKGMSRRSTRTSATGTLHTTHSARS